MKILDSNNITIEINNLHWPLAADMFCRWGITPSFDNEIKVKDIHDIAPELSAWGIPWRYI